LEISNTEISGGRPLPTILFIVLGLNTGGTESQLYNLVRQLHGRVYLCKIFALDARGGLTGDFKKLGCSIYSGGVKMEDFRKRPWKILSAMFALIGLARRLKPEIVHAFFPMMTFVGSLSARLAKVHTVIISRRSLATYRKRHPILRITDRLANGLSHRVLVNSKAVWNDMVARDRVNASKIVLIYNGVDVEAYDKAKKHRRETRRILGVHEREKVIIMVANLIRYKGHSDFLKAVKTVITHIPRALVLFVGEDRGIQSELEQEALSLGISERINYLGLRNDIPYLLTASDLSVLSSHEEGFSNVILESMAAGLPMVATRVGGNEEAVVEGITGWLVPPRDPTALADKMLDLLNHPGRARKWGERGRMRVINSFTIDHMIQRHLSVYEGLPQPWRNPPGRLSQT